MPRKKSGTRRPSKAAVLRSQAAAAAAAELERMLPPEIAAAVDAYRRPGVDPEQQSLINTYIKEVLTAADTTGTEAARKLCTHLSSLALFVLGRGLPLQVSTTLTTTVVDEYIRVGMVGEDDHLRSERRRRLLQLARRANPGPDSPARLTPIGHVAVKPPYLPTQCANIRRVALAQSTPARRRDVCAVVGLGAGAGLDSVDLRDLHVHDVEDRALEGIWVHVHGSRPRLVPVRRAYEPLVRAAVEGRDPGELLLGHKPDRRNTAARAFTGAELNGVPPLEPGRLRATWLADLMTDPVPIGVILKAAGLRSARTLAELQPHLEPWMAHKGITVDSTRGGGAR